MPSIRVVPIAPFRPDSLSYLTLSLAAELHLHVKLESNRILDSSSAFNSSRNQYNSSELISLLLEEYSSSEGKILGVTSGDLFVPVLTYVFGEAQLNGKVAVVSDFRLSEVLYGLPENQELKAERFIKEAMHEIGHTLGLVHCVDFACVMHSSTSVEEIDLKSRFFCRQCLIKRERNPSVMSM